VKRLSTREKTYVLVFVLALIWGGWNYRHLLDNKVEPPLSGLSSVNSRTSVALQGPVTTATNPENVRDLDFEPAPWSDDPFHRTWRGLSMVVKAEPGTSRSALHLSSIVVRPDATYAVINGKSVQEGETVAGRTVTRIGESHVVLDDRGVEVTLSL